MTMRVRAVLMLAAGLAVMGLASCGHYTCGATFGSSSCTPSSGGLGTSGGGGGSATAAFVFVADAAGTGTTGTIDGYTLNTTAATFGPTPSYTAPATPLNDNGVGLVVAQEKFLYTGFASTEQILGWSIGSDGSLTAAGSPYAAPFMSSVPAGFGTQSIMVNPAGTLLFFSTFLNNVYVYQIGTGGVLTAATGSPFTVSFSGNLATDGLGNYLYITDASGHAGTGIAAYVIGSGCATTGGTCTLTAVPGSPFTGANYSMWQVQGEPTGKYLIGTTGQSVAVNGADNDNLYVFGITTSGANAGAITQLGSVATGTNSPLSVAVQSNTNGNLVYSFGIEDSALGFNPVDGFSLNSTGALTQLSTSPFSNAAVGDQGALDQNGAFLFVYGAIFNESTQTFTYQMGAFDVGTGSNLGTLTEPTSTLTLTNGGYFAVTDPQ
jgi:hypothetical protein